MPSRLLSVLFFLGFPAFGQHAVEAIVKIGIPLSETFQTGSFHFLATGLHEGSSATRRYTVGGGVGLRLARSLGAEVDVLYKRLGYDITSSSSSIPVVKQHIWTTANSWEFPLLGVVRPRRVRHMSPRLSAGVSFRAVTGGASVGKCVPLAPQYSSLCAVTVPTPQPTDAHLSSRSSFGGTFGAAIETPLGPIRLTPEIRYTRWRVDLGAGDSLFDLRSNRNQLDFLMSITF